MSEVHDRRDVIGLAASRRQPAGTGSLPFMEDELCPPDAFEDLEPDEQYFHEATGNEGASFERTYRRAALVLWPRARRLAVLNQAGLAVTLPYLGELTGRWTQSGEGPIALWREAHSLSGHMLRAWPRQVGWYPGRTEARSDAATLLTLLSQLQDAARIDTFLDILAAGAYSKGDNAAIVRAAGLLPPEQAAALLEHLIASQAVTNLSACGDLAGVSPRGLQGARRTSAAPPPRWSRPCRATRHVRRARPLEPLTPRGTRLPR